MEFLQELLGRVVSVTTLDGRLLVGTLKGVDQACSLILADSHERLFAEDRGMEKEPLGLYIVRGDSV